MRLAFLALLALAVLTTACDQIPSSAQPADVPLPADSCPALTVATSAQVFLPPGTAAPRKGAYRLTDPETLHRLAAFIRVRSVVGPPSYDTPVSPRTRVMFTGGHSIAVFGSNPGLFYFQCGSVKGVRSASEGEQDEFQALIEAPSSSQ